MPVNKSYYRTLINELQKHDATLVAVSKTKPVEDILDLYAEGHRDFGENYVNELNEKYKALPKDIRWHFIGHLQRNKVKVIAPYVHLIHGVDSERLLAEISKEAVKLNRNIDVLLQVHIADEETKFGFDKAEVIDIVKNIKAGNYPSVSVQGLMGMATFTDNTEKIQAEFQSLRILFDEIKNTHGIPFKILSMGMSADYLYAVRSGSNMVRIGSAIFGSRNSN